MTHSCRAKGVAGLGLALMIALAPGTLTAETARAEVSGILVEAEALDSSTAVRVSRIETFTEEELIKIGTQLAIGDMLTSLTGDVSVELACGESTILRFANRFQVIINPPEEADCAVNFLNGDLDVLTNEPTEVEVGTVILGSEGTQYSVEVSRADGELDRQLIVFDGKIRVRGPEIDSEVETGATWRLRKGDSAWGRVDDDQLARVSSRYARFDAARVSPDSGESRAEAQARFTKLHYQVLEKPSEPVYRGELAKEQLKVNLAPQAYYHLRRGDITTSEKLTTYRIDAQIATELAKPATLDRASVSTDRATVFRSPVADMSAIRVRPDPFALIEQKSYQEAIEILSQVESKSSRTYYGLALAFQGLQGPSSSRADYYAKLALEQHGTDQLLSSADILTCRRILSH